MKTIKLHADLHCGSCENKIKSVLGTKVEEVLVNVASGLIKVTYNEETINEETIKDLINTLGFNLK